MIIKKETFIKLHKELWENVKEEILLEKERLQDVGQLPVSNYSMVSLEELKYRALQKVMNNHENFFEAIKKDGTGCVAISYLERTQCFACMLDFWKMLFKWDHGFQPPKRCSNCPLIWGTEKTEENYFCEAATPYHILERELEDLYDIITESFIEYTLEDCLWKYDSLLPLCDEIIHMEVKSVI